MIYSGGIGRGGIIVSESLLSPGTLSLSSYASSSLCVYLVLVTYPALLWPLFSVLLLALLSPLVLGRLPFNCRAPSTRALHALHLSVGRGYVSRTMVRRGQRNALLPTCHPNAATGHSFHVGQWTPGRKSPLPPG